MRSSCCRNILSRLVLCLAVVFVVGSAPVGAFQSEVMWNKGFVPGTIGPGSVSALTFAIQNLGPNPVTDLAFTDVLPAGVTIATPAAAVSTCGGTLSAPAGGTTISLSGGLLAASGSCAVSVNVTSSTPATHQNVSGDLTSSAGNSGPAIADLIVATNRPGFTKSFSPSTVGLGGRSTLTLTIDNSANAGFAAGITFVDPLPVGLVVADPTNASTSCTGGILTAVPGTGLVSMLSGLLVAGEVCTVTVDVTATGIGTLANVTGELTSSPGGPAVSSGRASAVLEVIAGELVLIKELTGDPVPPGGVATLELTILNRTRSAAATGIAFTDDLDATLSGLVATGLPLSNPCGAGSVLSGTSVLSFTGGSLPPEGSCTFSVQLQVPAGAAAGEYPNVTSSLTATLDGSPFVGSPASDTLFVSDAPVVTKTFLTDPAGAGGTTTLEFTITNSSASSAVTDVAFSDNLDQFLSGVVVGPPPAAGFCGGGSSAFIATGSGGDRFLFVTGGNLPAGGSCTFQVGLTVPANTPAGTYLNTTSTVTAIVDGATQTGRPAAATLTVVGAPRLQKEFTDDPVAPGDTVTLELTLSHDETAPGDATAITFTDDLDATLGGLTAVGLPASDVCGTGSQLVGTTTLTLTGGTLAPGESCTFSVALQVPAAALPGSYDNTTSAVGATVLGVPVIGAAAADTLTVTGLSISKSFTDDPVIPGDTVTLEFTIENTSTALDATGLFFIDNLTATLSGLAAVAPLPTNPCGVGSSLTGTTSLVFSGGNLSAGASCTFGVTLQVPAAAADGIYVNVTSALTGTVGGSPVTLDPASDALVVDSDLLLLSKLFTDDPVAPGDTVTLEFTLENQSGSDSITGITFTDDLDAALPGLVAVGLPANDVCGAGSLISGTSLLTLTGGTLPPAGACTFSVTLQTPAAVPLGTVVTNTTSSATGTAGGLAVTGDPATDDLEIFTLELTKSFSGATTATGTVNLSFTIRNLSSTTTAAGLAFTDDLDAVLPGLVAAGLPMSDVCGTGSSLSGTSFLTISGASLLPSGSCTFVVPVQVPAGAAPGSYLNTTSGLTSAGLSVAEAATATLQVEPPPTFSKVFAPAATGVGLPVALTLTVDNSASAVAASDLAFTDALPAGMVVATPANATTTCGGTLTAIAGTGVVALSGGAVAAGASCTVQADVIATAPGALVNTTGDLTSSSGSSGTAEATLQASPPPGFGKVFSPFTIPAGGTSTLTFTIDNTAAVTDATALDFTDNLPAGVALATPTNASTTCTGGVLTAAAGSGTIAYGGGTVAAGAVCTVSVDVTAAGPGYAEYVNLTGNLTSSLGTSTTATDTLIVERPPQFSKVFAPGTIPAGGTSTLTFTIDGTVSGLDATGLDFTDTLPAGVLVATPSNAATTCTGGTLTAADGSGTITYTGGSVTANTSCTVAVDVTSSTPGTHTNLSGNLTSNLGDSGPATADLIVSAAPIFAKAFSPAAIPVGGTSTLTFTIDAILTELDATGLDFTDALPAGVVVATPANAATTCTGGTLTAVAGSGAVAYTGGTVATGITCAVSVDVTAPGAGTFTNLSGSLTSSLGDSGPATADLIVSDLPVFSKAFGPATIEVDGVTTLTFTIDATAATLDATGLDFTDPLPTTLVVATPANASTTCTGGVLTAAEGSGTIAYTGGSVTAGASCTVSVDVTSSTAGDLTNVTGELTSSLGSSGPATADLTVVSLGLEVAKTFLGDPVLRGGPVVVEYTISNTSSVEVSDLALSDDFDGVLAGLAATGLPAADVCGAGSSLAGTSVVALTGGSLAAGGSCTFAVTVVVPPDAALGTYLSTTSAVDGASVGGPVTAPPAADDLVVVYLGFEKSFGGSATPGGLVALSFTLTNPDPVNGVQDLGFTDDLSAVLPGLVAVGLPASDVCGVGSSLTGTSVLTLSGGSLPAGGSCTFDVQVQIPAAAAAGESLNTTSVLVATVGGQAVAGDLGSEATAPLQVLAIGIPALDSRGLALLVLLMAAIGSWLVARRRG